MDNDSFGRAILRAILGGSSPSERWRVPLDDDQVAALSHWFIFPFLTGGGGVEGGGRRRKEEEEEEEEGGLLPIALK